MTALTGINAASPLDSSDDVYESFAADTTETRSFALDNMPFLFETMNTASWTIEYRQQLLGDDTLSLAVRIMSGATVLAAADSGGTFTTVNANVTNTTDVTDGPTAFAYTNTAADKATWDAAVVEIQQTYSQNMGKDGTFIQVDWFQLTGDYVQGAVPVDPDFAFHEHHAESPSVTQIHAVISDESSHTHAAESPPVTQIHKISSDESTHLHVAESPNVDVIHKAGPNEANHLHVAESPSVTQIHKITPNEGTHLHVAESPSVLQHVAIPPHDGVILHVADNAPVDVIHLISPNEANHTLVGDVPPVGQTFKVLRLYQDGAAESIEFIEAVSGTSLMGLDHETGTTVYGELIENDDGTFRLDHINGQVIAFEFREI